MTQQPATDWIPSFSIEARPEQLVGHRVEMASKDGGGWTATVAELRGHRFKLTDGTERPPYTINSQPFETLDAFVFDIARARIID